MVWIASARKSGSLAMQYGSATEIPGFARITMNSVEPQPISDPRRSSTTAVFPFSRQGVIRARRVSRSLNLVPEVNSRRYGASACRRGQQRLHFQIWRGCPLRQALFRIEFDEVSERPSLPSPRQAVGAEAVGEKGDGGGVHVGGGLAEGAGVDGGEIHEPGSIERPRHLLQRRAHPAVQLDLVVKSTERRRNSLLYSDLWKRNLQPQLVSQAEIWGHVGREGHTAKLIKKFRTARPVV